MRRCWPSTTNPFGPFEISIDTSAKFSSFREIETPDVNARTIEFGSIAVGEFSLRAQDMENNFAVKASFAQVDVVTAAQEGSQAQADLEIGAIDMDRYRLIRRYEDPTTLDRGVIEDRVKKMPLYMAQREVNALRRLGEETLADELEAQLNKEQLVGPDGKTPLSAFRGNGTDPSVGTGRTAV